MFHCIVRVRLGFQKGARIDFNVVEFERALRLEQNERIQPVAFDVGAQGRFTGERPYFHFDLLLLQQRRKRDAQAVGDFPDRGDGGTGLPDLDLSQHTFADAREVGQLRKTEIARFSQHL